jgi:hypothetical protein
VINVSKEQQSVRIGPAAAGLDRGKTLYDNIAGREVPRRENGAVALTLDPFQRMWLSAGRVAVDEQLLFRLD